MWPGEHGYLREVEQDACMSVVLSTTVDCASRTSVARSPGALSTTAHTHKHVYTCSYIIMDELALVQK